MQGKEIRIKKDGKWYFGNAEMFRRDIVNLLAKNIQKENGEYMIRLGDDCNPLVVEDVPYYATGLVEGNRHLKLVFHDKQEFLLDREIKIHFKGDVPYISFRWDGDTRLSRGIYWKLSDFYDIRGEEVYIVPPGL